MLRYNTRLVCHAIGMILLVSASIAQSAELWRITMPAGMSEPSSMPPMVDLIARYQEQTSLQQDANNKAMASRGAGVWVTDRCLVEDVRASNEFSDLKNVGFEVECRTNRPTVGTKAVLYFPQDAETVVSRLRRGQQIHFRGMAGKVDGFSQIKTAYVHASSLFDSGGAAPPKQPSVPKLSGYMDQVSKQLIAAGWNPRPMPRAPGEYVGGMAKELQALGLIEAEDCAGTGMAPCVYNYIKDGACLRVFSRGELWEEKGRKHFPGYDSYERKCP